MAKYLDENGLLYFWSKIVAKFATKDDIANAGNGDMLKSVYDTNSNGVVDDAEKLGGQTPDYYMPASAKGQANGVASLGADGKVPATQLPETAPPEHEHEMSDINGLEEKAAELVAVASGKCAAYVFDTVDALDAALAEYVAFLNDGTEMAETNILKGETLKTGDVFLIRAIDVPDYWWDESKKTKQKLETTKVDLTTITNAQIDTIVGSKGG